MKIQFSMYRLFSINDTNRICFLKTKNLSIESSHFFILFNVWIHTIPEISVKRLSGSVPMCPQVSNCTNLQHASEMHHWDSETCIFYPDVLMACGHHCWLLTLKIEKRPYFSVWRSNSVFWVFFLSPFILVLFHFILYYLMTGKWNKRKRKFTHILF